MQVLNKTIFNDLDATQTQISAPLDIASLLQGSIIATYSDTSGDVSITLGVQGSNQPPPAGLILNNGWVPDEDSWFNVTGTEVTADGNFYIDMSSGIASVRFIRIGSIFGTADSGTVTCYFYAAGNE